MATPKIKIYKLPIGYNQNDTDIQSVNNDELLPVINKPTLLEDAYELVGVKKISEHVKKIGSEEFEMMVFYPELDYTQGFGTPKQYLPIANIDINISNETFAPRLYSVVGQIETLIPKDHYIISFDVMNNDIYMVITFDDNAMDEFGELVFEGQKYPETLKMIYRKKYDFSSTTSGLLDYLSYDKLYNRTNDIFFEEVYEKENGNLMIRLNNEPLAWDVETNYLKDDAVLSEGKVYLSLIDNTGNATSTESWKEAPSCYYLRYIDAGSNSDLEGGSVNYSGLIDFYNYEEVGFVPYAIYYTMSTPAKIFVSDHQNWVINHLGDNPDIFYGMEDYAGDDRVVGETPIIPGLLPSYIDEGFSVNYREGTVTFANEKDWGVDGWATTQTNENIRYKIMVKASYAYYVKIRNVNNQELKRVRKTDNGWLYKAVDEKRWQDSHGKRWVMRNNVHMPLYFVKYVEENNIIKEKLIPEVMTYTPYDAVTTVATQSLLNYGGFDENITLVDIHNITFYRMVSSVNESKMKFIFNEEVEYMVDVTKVDNKIRFETTDFDTGYFGVGETKTIEFPEEYSVDIKVIEELPLHFQISNLNFYGVI